MSGPPSRARGFPDAQSCDGCAFYNPKVFFMDSDATYGKCFAFIDDTGRVPWVSSGCVCRRFKEDPHADAELCNVDGCHVTPV